MKRQQTTAFYLETLVLILVFVGIILVLTRIFGMGKKESEDARILTNAVTLSENAAEALSASDTPEHLTDLLNTQQNAVYEEAEQRVLVTYDTDMTPNPEGSLTVSVGWDPEETISGTLVHSAIQVWYLDGKDPVYTMDTAVYLQDQKE